MKKTLSMLLVLAMLFSLCATTALAAPPAETTEPVIDTTVEGYVTDYSKRSSTTPFDQAFDSYSVVSWFDSTDSLDKVFGRMYYPADFDESKTYPTVLMAHGAGINADIYDTYYAPALAEAGYICYAYDVRGVAGDYGSSRSTNNAGRSPDLETYVAEANAALDFIKSKSYVDDDSIYMWGQSMGAMTTEVVTAQRGEDLAGTILLYGVAGEERLTANGVSVDALKEFDGEVLLILGSEDPLASADNTVAEMAYYQNSSMMYISHASHGFGYMADRATQIATESVLDFLDRLENVTLPAPFSPEAMNSFNAVDANNGALAATDEGYTENFDGGYSVVTWIESNDGLDQIYAEIFYPADFDETQRYPTIVMAHGAGINGDIYTAYYAPYMANNGYVCITYDVRGVDGSYGKSRSTNNAERSPDLDTYVEDALAIIDYIKAQPYVDNSNFFMWGQSMGASTAQRVTSMYPDLFKATLLLYGAGKDLPEIKENHVGEALFVLGALDPLASYNGMITSGENYTGGYSLMYISGGDHGFGYMKDRPSVITAQTAVDFFDRITGNPTYSDVSADASYAEAVKTVSAAGLMIGVGKGKFDPEGVMTRAQIITVLGRLAGAVPTDISNVADVKSGSWYSGYVGWAVANGIVALEDGKFNPNATYTGTELDAILTAYAELTGVDYIEFPDSDLAMSFGPTGPVFAPSTEPVTRGVLAQRLVKLMNAPVDYDYEGKDLWYNTALYGGFMSPYQIFMGNGSPDFDMPAFVNSKIGEDTLNRIKYELAILGDQNYASEYMINYWASQGIVEKVYNRDDIVEKDDGYGGTKEYRPNEWIAYIPDYIKNDGTSIEKYPVVFCFHGGGGSLFEATNHGFVEICYDEGFIVIVPENNNMEHDLTIANLTNYVQVLADEGYPVDFDRIYTSGHSMGGIASMACAIRANDVVAASSATGCVGLGIPVGPNAMGGLDWSNFEASAEAPMYFMVGGKEMAPHLPLTDAALEGLNAWLEVNGCNAAERTDDNALGFTADRVYELEIDEQTYTFAEYYNADGELLVVFVLAENTTHWAPYSHAKLAWNFLKDFTNK